MAENGRDFLEQSKTSDKEARLRSLKDRQNEERQKKLEEIKAQALAAQRFKEQKEQERRRRLEELRIKDDVRRQQVEERKRAIGDAERDRLESILRRNQEREQRIEAKKRNEKSNIVFAFGSSTPRMLDPTDMTASFWGHRKATSIQNITCSTSSLTRRQSERDLDVGNKKRATSATGLERSGESSAPITPAGCASGYTGRRRTDLVPTIPSRDSSFASSRKSLNHSPASSRPSSSLSQQSTNSVASSVSVRQRPATTPRRPRPASIAVTGITHDLRNADKPGENKPPLPKTRKSLSKTHERPPLKNKAKSPVDSIAKDKTISHAVQNIVNKAANEETQQKPPDTAPVIEQKPALEDHPPEKVDVVQPVPIENPKEDSIKESVPISAKSDIELVSEVKEVEEKRAVDQEKQAVVDIPVMENKIPEIQETKTEESIKEEIAVAPENKASVEVAAEDDTQLIISSAENKENNSNNEMSSSMTKIRINTEEEAKAALAERRRLIREEAERQAEMERLRLEAEAQAELEKQQREEEQVRQLIELQRQTEQERLKEAIREAQKREEEERLKREEEQRLKLLKEEAEKKAREDAERQKAELQERLKNEEKEREARRKRVEAIMLRTRGKNNANLPSQQSTDDKNENKSEENKVNEENKINEENKLNEENKINEESKVNGTKIVEQQENGTTKNGKDVDIVDNIIPGELVKNANTVTIETMNSTDTINSNNSWQDTQQYGNFVCNNNS